MHIHYKNYYTTICVKRRGFIWPNSTLPPTIQFNGLFTTLTDCGPNSISPHCLDTLNSVRNSMKTLKWLSTPSGPGCGNPNCQFIHIDTLLHGTPLSLSPFYLNACVNHPHTRPRIVINSAFYTNLVSPLSEVNR